MIRASFRFAAVLAGVSSVVLAQDTPPVPTPLDAARAAPAAEPTPPLIAVVEGGLTADQAAARAIATSASIARAEASVLVAEAGALQAFSAVLPNLVLAGRATYTNPLNNRLATSTPEQLAMANAAIDQVSDPFAQGLFRGIINGQSTITFPYYRSQFQLSAQLSYPVTAAILTLIPLYRAAGMQVDAATIQRDVELATIALRAREAFYEHVRARGALVVATEARAAAQAHRDQVQALVDAGVASRADLLQVDAQVATADVAVRNASLGVDVSARALGLLMAADGEAITSFEVGEDVSTAVDVPTDSLETLEMRAIEQRQELEALRLSVRARTLESRARAGARYPQLSVSGNVLYANPNPNYIRQQREFRTTWQVMATLSWSPNDTIVAEGQRRQALATVGQLEAQEIELRDAVRLEVTQAYQQLLAAHTTIDSARAAVTAAEEAYRVRFEQLQQGVIVSTELADARTALSRAELDLVNASVQVRVAHARLQRALGEGGPTP